MRILFVSEFYPPKIMGGGEVNVALIAQALAERDIEVSILTSHHERLLKYERKAGVRIYRLLKTGSKAEGILANIQRSRAFPSSVEQEVKKFVEKHPIDLIHFIGTSVAAAPALQKLNIPLIATVESYPALCPKGDRLYHGQKECTISCSFNEFMKCQAASKEIGKTKNKFYLKYNPVVLSYIYNFHTKLLEGLRYCRLIAISKYVQEILQLYDLQSVTIPNAVDLKAFSGEENAQEQKNAVPKVVYLGSLIASKGPHILLQAVKDLQCGCELYGEGNLHEELQNFINKHNISASLKKPRPHQEVSKIYQEADIVVFPSVWPEPFGRIAIEAMAAGKPVIASAIGGIKETIPEGAGILVEPGNVDELRGALQELLENPELRKKMGKNGRKIAEKYSEEKVMDKLLHFYRGVQV